MAAVRTLLVILRFTVKQEERNSIIQKIKAEFARGKSCHSRMLFLKMCEMSLCLFSKLYFKTHLFSEFLCLGQDSVANIRLKVVSLLPQLKALLVLPADSAHLLHLEETIKELLVVETDRDVLGALQTSIHHLAEIETAMDGMSKMCLYSEDDMVDDRKLREERLIANMEEQIKQVEGAKLEQLMTPSTLPTRLRSLGLDRKRSESLPPPLTRGEAAVRKPRFNSPEPQRYPAEIPTHEPELAKPSYSQDIWGPDNTFEEKDFKVKNNPGPFSSSLENLDTQDSSFLVDAGIKLPTMSSAASMPNLTSVGKVKDQLSRSNSIPESHGNIDGELAKYLISNEEMEQYEAEYHKAAQETLAEVESPSPSPSPSPVTGRVRGRPESRMKPPSFTSALISRPAPAATAVSVSVNKSPISFSRPIQKTEKQEVRSGLKPVGNKSNQSVRNSPPKSSDERTPNQQRWNDGSIERLAEKWAAKRDALLKETGVIAENLQQRKEAMEQKLESVKRSLGPPKRSLGPKRSGFSPQSAQKRLSLCETSDPPEKEEKSLVKRKSLDVDIVIAPTESTSEESDEDNTSANEAPKSPELGSGSSDSDDSLPPYPAMEKHSSQSEQPLPPPPPIPMDLTPSPLPPPPLDLPPPPLPDPPPSLQSLPVRSPKTAVKAGPSPTTGKSLAKPSSRLQLLSGSPSRSSTATFKTVTAGQTSVAVSRQLPAPMRSIADSPRLPLPSKAPDTKPQSGEVPANKISGLGTSLSIKPPTKKCEPPTDGLKLKTPEKNDCRTPDVNSPGRDSSVLHINRSLKRVSKIATTQISSINRHDTTSFSSFKGQKCPEDESPSVTSVEQKAGKTIVYIENNAGNKLRAPSSILPKERSKMVSAKTPDKSQLGQSQSIPSPSKLKQSRYGNKSLSVDSASVLENNQNPAQMKSFLARSTTKMAGTNKSLESVSSPVAGRAGPRRSLGVRIWGGEGGQGRRTPLQSPVTSRSPSPARRTGDTSTLPRTSNISRLRVPGPGYAPQRRSYGGVSSPGRPGTNKNHSAPTTPRHSQAGSRSSSPVILRRYQDNQDSVSTGPSNVRTQLSGGQTSALLRPGTISRQNQAPSVATKSRIHTAQKTFGFSY